MLICRGRGEQKRVLYPITNCSMLPTNVVSFVKKMVAPSEADTGSGKATARLSKLKQTLTSGLQQAQESVNKLSPTRPFNAKLDLSSTHQATETELHRLLGKPSAPLSLPNLQQQGTETPVTSSHIPSSVRKASGPPDRATSCRVCVRSLSSGDVYHRLCTQCGLKVCDDCASYSLASQDEKEQNTWKCSICRRKNHNVARDLAGDPTNLSRTGTPTQLTLKTILGTESNSGSLPRRHSEQTLPAGKVVEALTNVHGSASAGPQQHRSSLRESQLPTTAEKAGRNQALPVDRQVEVYRSVTPALDNNVAVSASSSSTTRQRSQHHHHQRDNHGEERMVDKSQIQVGSLLKPRRDGSLELDRHRRKPNVTENGARSKDFLQPTHHKVYAVRSVEDLRQASNANWDRSRIQRKSYVDKDRNQRRKDNSTEEERFTATPSPRPVSSTSASASESSIEEVDLQAVTESADTWGFRRGSQRRRARIQRQKSREAEMLEDRRRTTRDHSSSPRHQLLVPLGAKVAARRLQQGVDATATVSTSSSHQVYRRYSSESSDASSDIIGTTEGVQRALAAATADSTGTAEDGPECLRSSFRRRSSFRASRSKQHRYELDVSDGYDADEQSIETMDSSPSPASPEPPLSGMHFNSARRLTPGNTESLEDDACEGSRSRSPRSSSRLSLGANPSDEETRRTRRRSSQWSEGRALPTPPLTPRNSFQLPKRDERVTSSAEQQQHSLTRGNSNPVEGEAIRIVIHDVDSDRHIGPTSGAGPVLVKEHPDTRLIRLQKETVDLHNSGVRGFGLSVIGGKPNASGRLETWINRIRRDGPADRAFLCKGQKIVRWNGITLTDKTFEEVQAILERTNDIVDIEVEVNSDDKEEDGPSRFDSKRSVGPSARKASGSLNVSQDSEPEKSPPASPTRRRLPKTPADLMTTVEAAGRIQLRLWYNADRGGRFVCTVIKGEEIRSRDQDGIICWVQIHLQSPGRTKRNFSTETMETCRSPCWDSIFTFSDLNEIELVDSVLEVSVWEEAMDREKISLGEAVLQLGRMSLEGRPIWYQLVDDARRNGTCSITPGDSRLAYAKDDFRRRYRTLSDDNDNSLELNNYDTDSSNGGPLPKSTSADFNLSFLHPEQAWKSGVSAPASLASSRRGSSHGSPILTNLDQAQIDRLLPRSLPPSRRGSNAFVKTDSADLDSNLSSAEGLLTAVGRKEPKRSLSFRMNRDENWDKDAKLSRSASLRRGTEEGHNGVDQSNIHLRRIPGPGSRIDAITLGLGPAQIPPLHLAVVAGQLKLGIIMTKGQMEVEVIGARSLPKGPGNMPPDTYVRLYIRDEDLLVAKHKTRIMRQTTSPLFHQTFSFAARELSRRSLLVCLIDCSSRQLTKGRTSKLGVMSARTLGLVELSVNRLPLSALNIAWYPIFTIGDDYRLFVSDDESLNSD